MTPILMHCGVGGPVLREGGIFGKNAFSDISFYWPKDQESSLGNMIFQKGVFVKRSSAYYMLSKMEYCVVFSCQYFLVLYTYSWEKNS